MNFKMEEAIEILERTPPVLEQLLTGLSVGWLEAYEGEGTWNAMEVVDHLTEAERTNWLPRLKHLLEYGENEPFPPFDRYVHLQTGSDRPILLRLAEFGEIRARNIASLREMFDAQTQLERTGSHPTFGSVKASELLSTWVVHDLTHLAQITRVLAERYRADVGPWREYLGILRRNP